MKYIKTVTISPLNHDGSVPTLMATGYKNKSLANAVTTGYFPAPMVVEVWECAEGEVKDHSADEFIKYIMCGRFRGRKITNGARAKIMQAVRELSEKQFIRLRRLTTKEVLRLQGVSDEDIEKMKQSGNSDRELYKQAGNSICVDVLEKIFETMFVNR